MSALIMSWSECSIKIGKTGALDAMAATLTDIGVISDKTTNLSSTKGNTLQATASGGKVVAMEQLEGGVSLTTRVKEPDDALFTTLGLGAVDTTDYDVKTHVVSDNYSVELTPKNVGATGIRAPKTNVSFLPGFSEEEGNYVDVTFDFIKTSDDKWYKRFKKA